MTVTCWPVLIRAVVDAADADSADVIVVLNAADLDLQRLVRIAMRRGNVLEQRFENRHDIRARLFQAPRRRAGSAAGVEHREIERLIIGAEFDEQIEDFIQHLIGAGIRAVDLVDDDDRPQLVLERLFQHEARLRHGPFGGVDEQEHAVGHAEHAFDFAAEIGVARRVDQVDLGRKPCRVGVVDGDVLGQDRDAALAFERIAVEQAFLLSWLSRKLPLCRSRASTSVVFPWSTWAMMATFRISFRTEFILWSPFADDGRSPSGVNRQL